MNAGAVLVCHRGQSAGYSAEWTFWADVQEARRAEAELCHPCGPLCVDHTIARLDAEREPRRRPSSTRTTATASAVAADGADT